MFGFIGMLVGPLILAMLVALIKFYEQNYMRRKQPQNVLYLQLRVLRLHVGL